MERKRVGGRFVREGLDGDGGAEAGQRRGSGAPKPKQCRTFARKKVAESLPDIVQAFVDEAKKGSIGHAKMLATLSGLDKDDKDDKSETRVAKRRRGKSAMALLMEAMNRKPEEK